MKERRYQFSIATLMVITVYFAVVAALCTAMSRRWLRHMPSSFLVFHFSWTAVVLAQLMTILWAWWPLGKRHAAGFQARNHQMPTGDRGGYTAGDHRQKRFRSALARGILPPVLWLLVTFGVTQQGNDAGELLGYLCLIFLQLLPLMLIDAIRYMLHERQQDDLPLFAMRLTGIAGFFLPMMAMPVVWLIGF